MSAGGERSSGTFAAMRRAVVLVSLLVLVAGCGGESSRWSSDTEDQLRKEFCKGELGVEPGSSACDCVVAATKRSFATPKALSQSKAPPAAYLSDLRDCGFGPTSP